MRDRYLPTPEQTVERLQEWNRSGKIAKFTQVLAEIGLPKEAVKAFSDAELKVAELIRDGSLVLDSPAKIIASYDLTLAFVNKGSTTFKPHLRAAALHLVRSQLEQIKDPDAVIQAVQDAYAITRSVLDAHNRRQNPSS